MIRSTLFATIALTASAASTLTAPAFAAETPRAEVRYNDIRLTSADGAKVLKARVARAAHSVCATNGAMTLQGRMDAAACEKVAIAKAMPQVELALANASHNSQLAENSRVSVSAH